MTIADDGELLDYLQRMVGVRTPRMTALHPVESSEVRRFRQATLFEMLDPDSDPDPLVVPLAFPVHMFRRPLSAPDPLALMTDPDCDGMDRDFNGLPALKVPMKRLLNGGYRYRFSKRARIGDIVSREARYVGIRLKQGRSGPMVFVEYEGVYFNGEGETLLSSTNTMILR